MSTSRVSIARVFPDVLGTYGDNGNASIMQKRLEWRGHSAEIIDVNLSDKIPEGCDMYLMGGGEDAAQTAACEVLRKSSSFAKVIERGANLMAVCASFQILGKTFVDGLGQDHQGLEVFDVVTKSGSPRLVGDVVVDTADSLNIGNLVGYENHGGNTFLNSTQKPLSRVIMGFGNERSATVEGAISGSAIGTYLHGPAFLRNPKFVDYFVEKIVGPVEPLKDDILGDVWRERMHVLGQTA